MNAKKERKTESAPSLDNGQTSDQKKNEVEALPDLSLVESARVVEEATEKIKTLSSQARDNFVAIGAELSKLRQSPKALTDCGYQDVYDYSKQVFGFESTSAKNFIAVYEKFHDAKSTAPAIEKRYQGFSYSSLVELTSVEKEKLSDFKPDMTVKAIRDQKIIAKIEADEKALKEYLKNTVERALKSGLDVNSATVTVKDGDGYVSDYYDYNPYPAKGDLIVEFSCEWGAKEKHESRAKILFRRSTRQFGIPDWVLLDKERFYDHFAQANVAASGLRLALSKVVKDSVMQKDNQKVVNQEKATEARELIEKQQKESKPEWILWMDMPESERIQSLAADFINDEEKHAFFAIGPSYLESSIAEISNMENDIFFPLGLCVMASFEIIRNDPKNPDDIDFGEDPKDTFYLRRKENGRLSAFATINEAEAYIYETCLKKKAEIDAEEAAKAKKAEK